MHTKGPRQEESFRRAIAGLNVDSVAAFNRGDVSVCAGFYAEDATLLLPDRSPVKGRIPIENCLKDYAASGFKLMPVDPVEILSNGDFGCCAGTYRFQLPSGSGMIETRTGKFVTVFRLQEDGSWKAVIDSFFADSEPGQ